MDAKSLAKIATALNIKVIHRRDDGWWTARCPFAGLHRDDGTPFHKHMEDNRPSFFMRASTDRRSGYNCYSCSMSGPIVGLITALEHCRGKKYPGLAIEASLAEVRTGMSFDYDDDEEEEPEPLNETAFGNVYPRAWKCKKARIYLKGRGIGEETSDLLGLLYDPEGERVIFPVRDRQNKLYGFTGRSIYDDDIVKVKDYHGIRKERYLLGAQLVDLSKPIILVEGLFALAHFIELRIDTIANVVASMGAHLSVHQASLLIDWGKPVYSFYDNDKAGILGTFGAKNPGGKVTKGIVHRIAQELPTYTLYANSNKPDARECLWPEGIDDPDNIRSFKMARRMMKSAELFRFDKEST